MNNTTPIIRTMSSDYYGSVKYRLVHVMVASDIRKQLESQGYTDKDLFMYNVPRTLKEAEKVRDVIAYSMVYNELLNKLVHTRHVITCKHDWNFLRFCPVVEDNLDWDYRGTEYHNVTKKRKLPIGCSEKDFERFYKKHGRIMLPQYDFKTVEEAVAYINKDYKNDSEIIVDGSTNMQYNWSSNQAM